MDPTQPDLSGIEKLIPPLAQWLGVQPSTVLLLIGLIITGCNIAGRVIPDTATGPLGMIRKIAKVVGLLVPNRIAPSVSVNDVAKAVVAHKTPKVADAVKGEIKEIIKEQLDSKLGPGE